MSLQTPRYPGVDPDEDRGPTIVAVGIVFIVFVFIVLALRFFSRVYTQIATALDDWLILAATVSLVPGLRFSKHITDSRGQILTWTFTILCMVGVKEAHYGQHVGKATLHDVEQFSLILYFMAIVYVPALVLSRVSLLALYWANFPRDYGQATLADRRSVEHRLGYRSSKANHHHRNPAFHSRPTIGSRLHNSLRASPIILGLVSQRQMHRLQRLLHLQRSHCNYVGFDGLVHAGILHLESPAIAFPEDLDQQHLPAGHDVRRVLLVQIRKDCVSERLWLMGTPCSVTITQGLRLWRLIHAQSIPGPDPTCKLSLARLVLETFLLTYIIHTVAEVDAGLWAIPELNLWIIVASIPALRPLVNKILSDHASRFKSSPSKRYSRSSQPSHSKNKGSFNLRYFKRAKGDHSSSSGDVEDQSALKQEATSGEAWSEPKNKYDVRVSAPMRREAGWTPLQSEAATEMHNLDGIRVEREFEISRPKSAAQMA